MDRDELGFDYFKDIQTQLVYRVGICRKLYRNHFWELYWGEVFTGDYGTYTYIKLGWDEVRRVLSHGNTTKYIDWWWKHAIPTWKNLQDMTMEELQMVLWWKKMKYIHRTRKGYRQTIAEYRSTLIKEITK